MVICSRLYTYVNPIDDGICPAAALMGFTYVYYLVRVWHRIDEARPAAGWDAACRLTTRPVLGRSSGAVGRIRGR